VPSDTTQVRGQPPSADPPAGAPETPGIARRVLTSLKNSAGSIVFGMEDGTVSIFGLVFGVSASAASSHVVLVAGATGAAAAAVSMMAGTYLDVESSNDQVSVTLADEQQRIKRNPTAEDAMVAQHLASDGFSEDEAQRVLAILQHHPATRLRLGAYVRSGALPDGHRSPIVESAWMFVSDLLAASIPVIPFAIFALATARAVSLVVTLLLLVLLGIGRATIGHSRVLPTVVQTIGIAAGAGAVGVVIGRLLG
jgi:VIT1/CCC1 family predicted Fe2+/Mn2+ transporter